MLRSEYTDSANINLQGLYEERERENMTSTANSHHASLKIRSPT